MIIFNKDQIATAITECQENLNVFTENNEIKLVGITNQQVRLNYKHERDDYVVTLKEAMKYIDEDYNDVIKHLKLTTDEKKKIKKARKFYKIEFLDEEKTVENKAYLKENQPHLVCFDELDNLDMEKPIKLNCLYVDYAFVRAVRFELNKQMPLVTANAVLFSEDGRLLVQKRTASDYSEGKLGVFGGGALPCHYKGNTETGNIGFDSDRGEILNTVIREVNEELKSELNYSLNVDSEHLEAHPALLMIENFVPTTDAKTQTGSIQLNYIIMISNKLMDKFQSESNNDLNNNPEGKWLVKKYSEMKEQLDLNNVQISGFGQYLLTVYNQLYINRPCTQIIEEEAIKLIESPNYLNGKNCELKFHNHRKLYSLEIIFKTDKKSYKIECAKKAFFFTKALFTLHAGNPFTGILRNFRKINRTALIQQRQLINEIKREALKLLNQEISQDNMYNAEDEQFLITEINTSHADPATYYQGCTQLHYVFSEAKATKTRPLIQGIFFNVNDDNIVLKPFETILF